jgi:type IV pilus assembly protein PilN
MMRINLLPIKAAKRHDVARNELIVIASSILVLVVVLYAWYASTQSEINDLQMRITRVTQEINQLKMDVDRVKDFKKSVEVLEKKKKAINGLYKKRFGPAMLLDDLATILTNEPKVWLISMTESGGNLKLEGGAIEHENISDFQLALERQSKFFQKVKLEVVQSASKDKFPYLNWKISCKAVYTAG